MKTILKALPLAFLTLACQNKTNTPSADTAAVDSRDDSMHHRHGMMGPMTHEMMVERMSHMDEMMVKDLGAADSAYDLRFIELMIPHHQGAIDMAKDALGKAKHPELKQMCEDIIKSQTAEIEKMKQWQSAWYGKK
jgi:uncharacterized protein (DUF305 family)